MSNFSFTNLCHEPRKHNFIFYILHCCNFMILVCLHILSLSTINKEINKKNDCDKFT